MEENEEFPTVGNIEIEEDSIIRKIFNIPTCYILGKGISMEEVFGIFRKYPIMGIVSGLLSGAIGNMTPQEVWESLKEKGKAELTKMLKEFEDKWGV